MPDTNRVPDITLNDGRRIPQLGFGTWQIDPDEAATAVGHALEVGYRHVDTAEMYRNEAGVGQALGDSGLDREAVWITSKLANTFHEPDEIRSAFEDTLSALGTDHVDLFLMHWPLPALDGSDFVVRWRVMEEFAADGRARSIGVSNFQVAHLQRLLAESEVVPAVNQVEIHPYLPNHEVRAFCAEHEIAIEAWSPLAKGDPFQEAPIQQIAAELDRSPAQVVLRWHLQHGFIVFPKSVTPERVRENFALFDFELSAEQMQRIDGLEKGEEGRTGPDPDTFTG